MPKEGKGSKEQPRDVYGFEVKQEYLDLHKKYAPLWAKEEQERRQLWQDYLNSFSTADESGKEDENVTPSDDFNVGLLEKAFQEHRSSGVSVKDDAWLQQLRTFVQAGIPMDLRGRLWKLFLHVEDERDPEAYDQLVSQALSPQYQNSKKVGERIPFIQPHHLKGNSGRFNSATLLEEPVTNGHPPADDEALKPSASHTDWNAQIEKDLHRTFPGHPLMDRSGRRSLRRILAAYACRNPKIGYCQGMNFIAGCLLLFMEEQDAFWCLTTIVEKLLPGYFDTTMAGSQVDQLVFRSLIEGQFGRLTTHLDKLGVSPISVSTQWFLCIYVNSLPLETCLRVWDIFFLERCASVLYRVALALIDIYAQGLPTQQALMATVDTIDAFILLQNMAPLSYDSSRLVDVACIAYQDVNHSHMQQLRSGFEEGVNARIQERLERTKSQAGKYQGPKARSASATSVDLELIPGLEEGKTKPLLDGLEVAAGRASLSMETSKAAQTAYKIASQPAKEIVDRQEEDEDARHHARDIAGFQAFNENEYNREDLLKHVKRILDKRKDWLAEDKEISDKTHEARVIHLKTLFARLEDEQFKLEAEEFETKVQDEAQRQAADQDQQEMIKVRESINEKEQRMNELKDRRHKEVQNVEAGRRRAEHIQSVLKRASAHRDLKVSLLLEKQELIKSLQQEIQQVSAKPSGGFMTALRSISLRRQSKD